MGVEMGDLSGSGLPPGGDPRSVFEVALARLREVLVVRDRLDELVEGLEAYLLDQRDHVYSKECSIGRYGPGRPGPPLARRLKIFRHPDGSATIYIDSEKPFWLPSGLVDLLEKLASDTGASSDTLVAWKSRASLREWFQMQRGMDTRPKYVNKRVDDLRRHLRDAGIKRHLVHTHDLKGVRFALLRGASHLTVRLASGGRGDPA
jgi:hypothetical protein